MLDALGNAGLSKPKWQPPLAFAATLRSSHPEVAEAVDVISRDYYRCRYGPAGRLGEEPVMVQEALHRLRRVLAVSHE